MSISALYVLDLFGKPLISRSYRGTHEPEAIDKFMSSVFEKEEEKSLTPVLQVGDTLFAFIKCNNIYFVASTNRNANISLVFVFLYRFVEVMHVYFKEVEEESVRDNFVIIYELLDEILDFGYPQTTESKILMEYITQESKKMNNQPTIPPAVTNAVYWRSNGIKYKKNELFMDIIESIDLIGNANGLVVQSDIVGCIKIKSCLSGMPELRLGINDKLFYDKMGNENENCIYLDEVKFHQCVRLCKFESDRNITFIPPDGEFELMTYRRSTYTKPPIWVESVAEYYINSRVEYTVKVMSHFKNRLTASNVDILIPVPSDVDSPSFSAVTGIVSYVPESNVIKWSIKSFPGHKEYFMMARFGLPSVASQDQDTMPPIQVIFQIPFFSISGIKVNYLKISDKSGYSALPWIRHLTQSGNYQIRFREVVHGMKHGKSQKKKPCQR